MFKNRLESAIQQKNSLLCIGLDCDLASIPPYLLNEPDPLYTFNKEIIEATADLVVAYKPNIAFYESDIANTASKYADLYFQNYNFDAITVSPYMGSDSIEPFLEYDNKCTFVLCLTSNQSAVDFQYLDINSETLYLKVAKKVNKWNLKYGNCGLVVGATHPENIDSIRMISPYLPFLIPGIGTQGGNLELTIQYGTDTNASGTLINIGRKILYASNKKNFGTVARELVINYNEQINEYRNLKLNR